MRSPKVSVIIPCLNEEAYIGPCLESVVASSYDRSALEVLVVDGGSADRTREIVLEYAQTYGFLSLLENPKKIVPVAMNIGIRASRGEYIVRLDAHASYPGDYIPKLIEWHRRLDADNVGGQLHTAVKRENAAACAIRNVLSDRLGVGGGFRTGVTEVMKTDTVPFGCYRRDVFVRFGLFDERLARNQDIELNRRIVSGGGTVYIVPDIHCTYYARETFRALAANNYRNGEWNILTAIFTRNIASLALKHYVPLLFLLTLLLPFPLGAGYLSVAMIFFYLLVVGWRARQISSGTTWLHQVWAFCVLHLSYASGEAAGIMVGFKHLLFGKECP